MCVAKVDIEINVALMQKPTPLARSELSRKVLETIEITRSYQVLEEREIALCLRPLAISYGAPNGITIEGNANQKKGLIIIVMIII